MFPVGISVVLTLLAACMWGSWMQIIKHRGDYPIEGIIFFLYLFSFLEISLITVLVVPDGAAVLRNIVNMDRSIIFRILFGGGLMSLGLLFSLLVMNQAGLLLATTISGTLTNTIGLFTTLFVEGLPDSTAKLAVLLLCAALFIVAALVCNKASQSRDRDYGNTEEATITWKLILMSLTAALLTNGWSIGTSTATANGFSPVVTCFLMATGSFLSVLIVSTVLFTKRHMWKDVFAVGKSKKAIYLTMIAAVCHYGGNLISIYSMPALSATVSFLFGRVSTLVTVLWGLFYKEFANTSRRTKLWLALGIGLFLLAVLILAYYTNGMK